MKLLLLLRCCCFFFFAQLAPTWSQVDGRTGTDLMCACSILRCPANSSLAWPAYQRGADTAAAFHCELGRAGCTASPVAWCIAKLWHAPVSNSAAARTEHSCSHETNRRTAGHTCSTRPRSCARQRASPPPGAGQPVAGHPASVALLAFRVSKCS